nr:unnamed protein product [Callosobruchus analis]
MSVMPQFGLLHRCHSKCHARGSSLLRDLKIEHDYGMFQNFCRMSSEDFKILLELVEPYKKKRKTCCNASSNNPGAGIMPGSQQFGVGSSPPPDTGQQQQKRSNIRNVEMVYLSDDEPLPSSNQTHTRKPQFPPVSRECQWSFCGKPVIDANNPQEVLTFQEIRDKLTSELSTNLTTLLQVHSRGGIDKVLDNFNLKSMIESLLPNIFQNYVQPRSEGGDFNGHHYLWGSIDNNPPVLTLVDAVDNFHYLIFRNEGQPTRLTRPSANISAIHVTILSTDLLDISTWTVMGDTYGSDHFPILININSITTNIDSHSTYKWRIYPHPDWNRFADKVYVTTSGVSDTASANTIITDIIHGIQNAADHVFKRKNNTHKFSSPPWWDNETTSQRPEGNAQIPWKKEYKYLGVTLDQKLTWDSHINNTIAEAEKSLNILKTTAKRHWDFGAIFYGSVSNTRLKKLNECNE